MELARKVRKELDKVLKFLGMTGWDVRVSVCLDDSKDCCMEVDTSKAEYSRADIVIYKIDKNLTSNLVHELTHAKIGLLTRAFEIVKEKHEEMVSELVCLCEEHVVSKLEKSFYEHFLK